MNLSQAMAAMLKAYGAEYFFTLTGGPQEPLMEAQLGQGIKVVLGRTERSAFAMADAYARLTGKPTFGTAQYGCGTAMLPFALVDAYWAHSPLIAINSAPDINTKFMYEYQELEQVPMMAGVTKWAGELPAPDRIADVMRTAVRAAVSGSPGPAYLSIPMNWYTAELSDAVKIYAEPAFTAVAAQRSAPVAGDIERAVEVLAKASRPAILAGGGVLMSSAWDELTALAEALDVPVVTSISGKGAIAETHPLAVGVCGRYSRKIANDTMEECDVLVVVGSRLGAMGTDTFKVPTPDTAIVHIDADAMNLGRSYREEVSICADAKVALAMLTDAAGQAGLPGTPSPWEEWTRGIQGRLATWREKCRERAAEGMIDGRLNPFTVLAELNGEMRPDDVVVADTGYMAAWSGTILEQKAAGRGSLRAAGSLGWAFPAAIGAKLAAGDDRRVLCLSGDGGMGYHLADLETALRLGLQVTTVVMNNAAFGFSYDVQRYLHSQSERLPDATEFLDLDFAAIATAFGAHGETVVEPGELVPAMRRCEESGKAALINVKTSKEVTPPVGRYAAAGGRDI
ncbi:MAG: thiamine pyrophosphate-binding protein [Rhodospirillales bacterium]|jgi:acetolactate synthase-1/2/3 large subunit|nr:thiamine pyrophosphate-binding protein [Rhodospirillales bacterium]